MSNQGPLWRPPAPAVDGGSYNVLTGEHQGPKRADARSSRSPEEEKRRRREHEQWMREQQERDRLERGQLESQGRFGTMLTDSRTVPQGQPDQPAMQQAPATLLGEEERGIRADSERMVAEVQDLPDEELSGLLETEWSTNGRSQRYLQLMNEARRRGVR